jgi:hypothetical protein
VPFGIAGAVIYIRLYRVGMAYETLTECDGYPDFMTLSEDIIAKKPPTAVSEVSNENAAEIVSANTSEITADTTDITAEKLPSQTEAVDTDGETQ